MIYDDRFVWLHFPKCAGTKVENLFRKYFSAQPGLFQDPVDPATDKAASWHDSLEKRELRDPAFSSQGRTVICPIRKLPSWLMSRYNFECYRSPNLPHNPELLLEGKFLESAGILNHADRYIDNYLPKSLLSSGMVRFLRTEYFEEDFVALFGDYVDVARIPRGEFSEKVNTSPNYVPEEIQHRLFANRAVYEKCPEWRAVEALAYDSF